MPGEQSKHEAVNFLKYGNFNANLYRGLSPEAKNFVVLFCRANPSAKKALDNSLKNAELNLEENRSEILKNYVSRNAK